jgi:hypothetical protein
MAPTGELVGATAFESLLTATLAIVVGSVVVVIPIGSPADGLRLPDLQSIAVIVVVSAMAVVVPAMVVVVSILSE